MTDETVAAKADEIESEAEIAEEKTEVIEDAVEAISDGNPDEEISVAVEELEPAAAIVAQEALDIGRPDLAAEVVAATLTTLADWAEGADALAETLEDVAAEIGTEDAIDAAAEAGVAVEESHDATMGTLGDAGFSESESEILMADAAGVDVDVPPSSTHWLMRDRFGRRRA
jgi:hypothetical protein